jgi:hypothetical protein
MGFGADYFLDKSTDFDKIREIIKDDRSLGQVNVTGRINKTK